MEDLSSFHLNISYIIAISYFPLQPYPISLSSILVFSYLLYVFFLINIFVIFRSFSPLFI